MWVVGQKFRALSRLEQQIGYCSVTHTGVTQQRSTARQFVEAWKV